MNIYSSDGSILVNKTVDCYYDLKVNPLFIGTGPSEGGFNTVAVEGTSSVAMVGNGTTIPIRADVKISTILGNQLKLGTDGLYVISDAPAYTNASIRALFTATYPALYDSSTGVFSMQQAGLGASGYLSNDDWVAFNDKVAEAESVGTGAAIYKQKGINGKLQFKKLEAGSGVTVTEQSDTIVIAAAQGNSSFTTADARAAISGSSPILYNNSTGVISIQTANATQPGALSSTDWNTFNNKVPASRLINITSPLIGGANLSADITLGIRKATSVQDGYLSKEDYVAFTAKQAALSWFDLTATSNKLTVTGGTGAVHTPVTIGINEANLVLGNIGGILPISKGGTGQATATAALLALVPSITGNGGKVLGTDGFSITWVAQSGGGGGENALTFNSPLVRTVDTISIPAASGSTSGYLTSANWTTFNNKVSDGVNLGTTGGRIFSARNGNNLEFRRIIAGTNMTLSETVDGIVLSAAGASPTGTTHAINTTVGDLANMVSPDLTKPYYITDKGREGFFYYDPSDTLTPANGNGVVIVNIPSGKRWKRSYVGAMELSWFDVTPFVNAKADYHSLGNDMIGTDATPALNNMMAAAGWNQRMVIGRGSWYFATKPNDITQSKLVNLEIEGDLYIDGSSFLRVYRSGLPHKIKHYGSATGKLGLAEMTKENYDANTGPDWDSLTGDFIDIEDSYKCDVDISRVDGFRHAVRIAGGLGSNDGAQEHRIRWKWLGKNKWGIRLVSLDGSSFIDKCHFYGGTIMGQYPISFEGNLAGASKTGVFTANNFHNVLIEAAETGITGTGVVRFNNWNSLQIEGGNTTGVFGPDEINLSNQAVGNNFFGMETVSTNWLANPGTDTTIYGSPIHASNGILIGSTVIGGIAPGRLTVLGTDGLSNLTKSNVAANIDIVTLLGISPNSGEARPNQFASVRINGLDQAVSYDGRTVEVTTAGNTILTPPTGWVRVNAGANAVTLIITDNQLFDGNKFFIEKVGSGTVRIVRSSDNNLVVLPTTQITSTGIWLVRVYNQLFTSTKIGSGSTATGDVNSTGVASATNQLVVFSGTSSKLIQPYFGNGYLKTTTGVVSAVAKIPMADLNATGFVGAGGTKFLREDGVWASVGTGGGSYTFSNGLTETAGVVKNNLITGIAADQTVVGSTLASGRLNLSSTTHGTKGQIWALDTIQLRANSNAAAPIMFAATGNSLLLTQTNGALEFDGTDLWFTCQTFGRRKVLTDANNAVLTNKTFGGPNPIGTVGGGTGLTAYTTGDLLVATATNVLGRRAAVATGNVLISQGVAVAPVWGKVGLTSHVSGLLPIANGGTNASTANAALNNLLPVQTNHDDSTLVTDGTNTSWVLNLGGWTRLGLTTNSTTATSMGTVFLPDNTGGEVECTLVGYNLTGNTLYKKHSIISYVKKAGVVILKGAEANQSLIAEFTPGGTVGFNLTSNTLSIRAASASTETVRWAAYYIVRPTF